MLLIRGKTVWKTHEPTMAQFELRAIGADEYTRLRDEHKDGEGKLDYIAWCAAFAMAAIANWRGVGDASGLLPCVPEHLQAFGRTHATHIMPWIVDQSTDLGRFIDDEVDAAKNG